MSFWPPPTHPLRGTSAWKFRRHTADGRLPSYGRWADVALPGGTRLELAVYADPQRDRYVSSTIAAGLVWEPTETALFLRALPRAAWFLDVGANLGWFACLARSLMRPGAPVIAVEPAPATLALLRATLARDPFRDVLLLPIAASDHDGTAKLGLSAANQGDNRLGDAPDDAIAAARVPTRRLDELLRPPPPGPGIVKLDVQGHEPRALPGMRGILSDPASPALALIEVWPPVLSRLHGDWRILLERLTMMDWFATLPEAPDAPLEPTDAGTLAEEVERRWMLAENPAEWYCNVVCGPASWRSRLAAAGAIRS